MMRGPLHPASRTRSSAPRLLGPLSRLAALVLAGVTVWAASTGGRVSITPQHLKVWLTYIASDELQGREMFSAGLGLAAAYISNHLSAWGVTPAGDAGSYLQTVRVQGVRAK